MATFIGFSSVGRSTGTQVLEDKELARRDLLNHFYTRKGERLGNPEFGSILPELIFEPLDQRTFDLADNDIREIIGHDPRWELIDYDIDPNNNNLTVSVNLRYVPDLSLEELLLTYTETEEI